MDVSAHTPDPLRDPPCGKGTYQSPGAFAVMPGRAQVDTRFNQYPMTYRVLGFAVAHAKANFGTFWVSHKTIGKAMGCSRQAISQHFTRLQEYGYIEKLRKEKAGVKGALWRVIYDPDKTWTDVKAWAARQHMSEEEEQEAIDDTLKKAAKGAKGQTQGGKVQLNNVPVDNSVNGLEGGKLGLNKVGKVELALNETTNNIDIKTKEDCRRLCTAYARIHERVTGRRWSWTQNQEAIAGELLANGYTVDSFEDDALELLNHQRRHGKDVPYSLTYFLTRRQKQGQPKTAEDIVKQTLASMRMR